MLVSGGLQWWHPHLIQRPLCWAAGRFLTSVDKRFVSAFPCWRAHFLTPTFPHPIWWIAGGVGGLPGWSKLNTLAGIKQEDSLVCDNVPNNSVYICRRGRCLIKQRKGKAAKSSDITNVNIMRKQWEAGKQVQWARGAWGCSLWQGGR